MLKGKRCSIVIAGGLLLMTVGFFCVASAKNESSDSLRAFYDALALKKYVEADTFPADDITKRAISGYFKKYLPDSLRAKNPIADSILAFIKTNNPFLNSFIRTVAPI